MNISSKLLSNAVDAFASLPGIGKKSALRLALHILQQDTQRVEDFCKSILTMRQELRYCNTCHNLSDADICNVCASPSRQKNLICVVETIREAMAVENTQQFNGVYHVLGGLISPLDGISPNMLEIDSLVERVKNEPNCELIMALSPTIEGETTIFYLQKQLAGLEVNISTIARGVAFGGELEYADELTLGRSITARIPYKNS